MGSRAPIAGKSQNDEPPEDHVCGHSNSFESTAASQLLNRIADALQVPLAVLYEPPSAVTSERTADDIGVATINLEQDCEALLYAYRHIRDPAERRRILALVQEAAEQT